MLSSPPTESFFILCSKDRILARIDGATSVWPTHECSSFLLLSPTLNARLDKIIMCRAILQSTAYSILADISLQFRSGRSNRCAYCRIAYLSLTHNCTYEGHYALPTRLVQNGVLTHDERYPYAYSAQALPFFQQARRSRFSEWFRALPARKILLDSISCDLTILSNALDIVAYGVLFHFHLHGVYTRCKRRSTCRSY